MEFGQQINENRNNAKLSLFQNQGYQFERRKTKTLLLDISSDIGNNMDPYFNVKLVEPLVIDTLSDIYLDSFTTYNALLNTDGTGKNMGFTLKINEFNINSNVGNNLDKTAVDGTTGKKSIDSRKFNTIFIPNSSSSTATSVVHKSKKFNYICSINPGKLTNLSGSLFDAGHSHIRGTFPGDGSLKLVSHGTTTLSDIDDFYKGLKISANLPSGVETRTITQYTGSTKNIQVDSAFTGSIASAAFTIGPSDKPIYGSPFSSSSGNLNQACRFIAEFVIVSRE